MDNKELIRNLLNFDAEDVDASTGFVSATGTPDNIFLNIGSVIHTFGEFIESTGYRIVKTTNRFNSISLVITNNDWALPANHGMPVTYIELEMCMTGKKRAAEPCGYEGKTYDERFEESEYNVGVFFRDLNRLSKSVRICRGGMDDKVTGWRVDIYQDSLRKTILEKIKSVQPLLKKFCETYGRNYMLKESAVNLYTFDDESADTSTGFVDVGNDETDITQTRGYKVGKLFLKYLISEHRGYVEISFDGLCSYEKHDLDDLIMSSNWLELRINAPEGYSNQNNAYNLVEEDISLSLCPYDGEGRLKKESICNLFEQFKTFAENYNPQEDLQDRVEYIYDEYGYVSEERGANIRDEISEEDVEGCLAEIQSYLKGIVEDFVWDNEDILEELGYEI